MCDPKTGAKIIQGRIYNMVIILPCINNTMQKKNISQFWLLLTGNSFCDTEMHFTHSPCSINHTSDCLTISDMISWTWPWPAFGGISQMTAFQVWTLFNHMSTPAFGTEVLPPHSGYSMFM
jgi:hypothetical protein